MKRNYFRIGDWRRNVLLVAAATSLGLNTLPACSGGGGADEASTDGQEWNGPEAGQTYSKGVITEMTEVQPGEWKITAERPAGKEEVAAILRHFDGKVDTLQGQALQRQMQDYSRRNPENRVGSTGMMDVLMWSGIGYMAGRFLTPQPSMYAGPGVLNQTQGWRAQTARERDNGRGFYGRGFSGSRASAGATSGIRPSQSVVRSGSRPSFRGSAPRGGRSSGFGSRGFGGGGRGFGG